VRLYAAIRVNRILPQRPEDEEGAYTFGTPPWLVLAFRGVLLGAGFATGILLGLHWKAMPWPACLLAACLFPSLMAWSLWPRPWRYMVRFIANQRGMYFPAYPVLSLSTPSPPAEAWLEVPWRHISNIRLANEVGEDGRCVALDIEVSSDEKSKYFGAVGIPRDRQGKLSPLVFAAYGGWPPSPADAVARLTRLRLGGGA